MTTQGGADAPSTEDQGEAGVTLISVAFNSGAVISELLASRPAGMPAIVVDNASADDSVEVARRAGATVLSLARNVGFGAGCNAGGFAAETPYILFANPDVVLQPGCVARMRDALEADPALGAVGPTLYDHDGAERPQKLFNFISDQFAPRRPGQPTCVNGCCFMTPRALFQELGGFDQKIFLFYEEDDLFHRLQAAGRRLALVEGAGVGHVYGRSSGRSYRVAWLRWFHDIRSKLYVSRKYGLPTRPWRDLRRGLVRALLGLLSAKPENVVSGAGRAWAALLWLAGRRRFEEHRPEIARRVERAETPAAAPTPAGKGEPAT